MLAYTRGNCCEKDFHSDQKVGIRVIDSLVFYEIEDWLQKITVRVKVICLETFQLHN